MTKTSLDDHFLRRTLDWELQTKASENSPRRWVAEAGCYRLMSGKTADLDTRFTLDHAKDAGIHEEVSYDANAATLPPNKRYTCLVQYAGADDYREAVRGDSLQRAQEQGEALVRLYVDEEVAVTEVGKCTTV